MFLVATALTVPDNMDRRSGLDGAAGSAVRPLAGLLLTTPAGKSAPDELCTFTQDLKDALTTLAILTGRRRCTSPDWLR